MPIDRREYAREYMRRRRAEHPEKIRATNRRWMEKNPEKVRQQRLRALEREVEKLERIAGRPKPEVCDVCGERGSIHFDHCHTSGEFRGWLCFPCNSVLGLVKDDATRLGRLAAYLANHTREQ